MRITTTIFCVALLLAAGASHASSHPQLYVQTRDREAVKTRLAQEPWAQEAYAKLKARVDEALVHVEQDRSWLTSRLMLHWNTHYSQAIVAKERWVRGEGRSDGPTVRFAGARDWVASHSLPSRVADWRPYNEGPDGTIWLINQSTKQAEWIAPGTTGRVIEVANARIMQIAAEAAFVYWLTGDARYARLGSDVVWAYTEAFARTAPPQVPADEAGSRRIIGLNSFEVIHEALIPPYSLACDFLYDTLVAEGRDVRLVQTQLQRLADRVIAGGGKSGNWNLHQANFFAHAGLVLEDNAAYADGHGRSYYVDLLLHADLPSQRGIIPVLQNDYDPTTALWPEAPGYAFGTTPHILKLATLAASDPAGRALLDDPLLPRAILAQEQLLHPDGYSIGLGDTYNSSVDTEALEY